jgi:hypothetical protein
MFATVMIQLSGTNSGHGMYHTIPHTSSLSYADEVLNVAAMMHPVRQLVVIAMYFV